MDNIDQKVLVTVTAELLSQSELLLEMASRILDLEKMVTKLLEARDAA